MLRGKDGEVVGWKRGRMMLYPCGILEKSPKRFTLKAQMYQRPRVYSLSLLC